MEKVTDQSGVIPRTSAVLSAIGAAGDRGARLVDLAVQTQIARPTVHRILRDLAAVGFVLQTPSKSYVLGPQLYWLGLNAQPPMANLPAIRNIAQELAHNTGDAVYFAIRQQAGVRYVLRTEGDFPIRTQAVNVGDLKPYTSTYSGIALLGTLPDSVIDAALQTIVVNAPEQWAASHPLEAEMREAIAEVKDQGWCYMTGVVMPGLAGMAAPIPTQNGLSMAALSIATIESRLPRERAERLAPELIAAANKISAHLGHLGLSANAF